MDTHPYIPYFQTSRYRVQAMIDLAEIKPGEKAADLGSGDGRIVIALAKAGAEAHGYELDQTLLDLSRNAIKDEGVENNACIHQVDFWHEDLSVYDIICIYPMPDIMEALEAKLFSELKSGSRILLNYYPFLTRTYTKKKDNIYLYIV